MVFKAVEGVVPPQGGLRQLWYSSDTLNSDNPTAQTLTKDPYLVYKSKNVETWRSIPGFFIESVRSAIISLPSNTLFSRKKGGGGLGKLSNTVNELNQAGIEIVCLHF